MKKNKRLQKIITISLIFFVIGLSIESTIANIEYILPTRKTFEGNTLYVGGNGPGNYSRIKDAIANATNGDTIFVYNDSSPYQETLVIDKTINLVGEDTNSTIIDGFEIGAHIIHVKADNVVITGFTIQNAGVSAQQATGLLIQSNNNIIMENIFQLNSNTGIEIYFCNYNIIHGNRFYNNTMGGILIYGGKNNKIIGNIIERNFCGMFISWAYNNNISFNTIHENEYLGIELRNYNGNNTFYQNNILANEFGIILVMSSENNFIQNNFIDNRFNARFVRGIFHEIMSKILVIFDPVHPDGINEFHALRANFWKSNFWDRSRVLPYPIYGRNGFPGQFTIYNALFMPTLINFDWHPAQEPYDIGV